MVFELLGGVAGYRELMASSDEPYELRTGKRVPDEECERIARRALAGADLRALKTLEPAARNARLRTLRDAGLSVRQVSMLTGIGSKTVSRATTRHS